MIEGTPPMPLAELTNQQFRLAARPLDMPDPSHWQGTQERVPAIDDGELLVKVLYLSIDPAMRMWINDERSYMPPVAIGDVMRAIGLGRVISSRDPVYREGDFVTGLLGVQEYAVTDASALQKVDSQLAPLPTYLSTLGLTGMSAYFGLLEIGRPRPGDTVVVSAAAGAVGATAGQIAKIKGCRVVGIVGGAEKCRLIVDEFGFDAAIDYKAGDPVKALEEACPNRVDVFFDNVGGDILDAVLTQLAMGARVVISGAVSQYNSRAPHGPANYMALAVDRARMEGFIVTDYAERFGDAAAELAQWGASGELRSREHIVDGLQSFPDALLKLFSGENRGKLILKVAEC
jgi:NADPH-dependent curcumin reductase CurA